MWSTLSRRRFLQVLGTTGLLAGAPAVVRSRSIDSAYDRRSDLFSLGVASGDPDSRSVVLWTRLAPDPLEGGGMPPVPVPVYWEVATDPDMSRVLRRGIEIALPRYGHAVHAVARGLPSGSWLYYRFRALGTYSRIGRTRTFPTRREDTERMRFAVANCQNYNQGFYTAYADMLTQDLDFVFHLGDYIYEEGPASQPIARGRVHNGPEVVSIADYRNRYALYKLDHNLQEAHAQLPFIVTPDDHEVDNNYAGLSPEAASLTQGRDFARRRRDAYQVYSETMPLRPENRYAGNGAGIQLYRRLELGDLATIHVLDTRQYRTDQPAGDGFGSTDPDSQYLEGVFEDRLYDAEGILDPSATLLGAREEAWLERGLKRSSARWNILAQQVMVMPWNLIASARKQIELDPNIDASTRAYLLAATDKVDNLYNVDAWDGYQAARQRLLGMLEAIRPNNPVILTGDIHSAWAAHLLSDFDDPDKADLLAVELVSTSISSTFLAIDPRPSDYVVRHSLADNPHVQYFNGLFRGYLYCDIDRDRCQATFRAVGRLEDIQNPDSLALVPYEDSPVATDAVFSIDAGFNARGSGQRLSGTSRLTPNGPV